jgi:ABC-type dipeptide/oligopeptide/nickel transport system permease subunit
METQRELNNILTIAVKEFMDNVKSKRFILIGVLYLGMALLLTGVTVLSFNGSGAQSSAFKPSFVLGMIDILNIILALLAVIVTADTISIEKKDRTIYQLLSKPVERTTVVLGKFLGRDVQTINIFGRSFSGSVGIVILVIGLTSWMYLARIVRANVLSLREMDYIAASKALGASNTRIFLAHLVPNTLSAIIVSATLGLASAILAEAYVSFLGLGVQPPTASWGNILTSAQSFIQRGAWWMWVFPSGFIVFTILCINLLGDGLRDALDPRMSQKDVK